MSKDEAARDAAAEAGRALSKLGAKKGGRARASVLTKEERQEIARRASRARWQREGKEPPEPPGDKEPEALAGDDDGMPYSMFRGPLNLGDITMECHVLSDGTRVLTAREVTRVITGSTSRPASLNRYLERIHGYDERMLAGRTVQFRVPQNPQIATGYDAELLIEICEMYLDARDAGKLKPGQGRLAKMAEIVMRACAKVGIIALIDEATGYQQVRERRALQVKLQALIAEDLQEWVATFPEEFFHELARLEGIRYSPRHRPLRWGKYVMRFVYDSIDPDLGKKLREINPDPRYKRNHHQWLREFGRDKLHRQLGGVIALMRQSEDMPEFRQRFLKVYGNQPDQLELFDLVD